MGVKIRQKDGEWYVFINHKGKRKAKCIGDSKRAAEEVKRKLEAKLTLGEFALQEEKPSAPTFARYAEEWLATYAQLNCKPSTYRRHAGVIRKYLLPAFGATPLPGVTRDTVKRLLMAQREHLTPSSVRQVLAPL
jgi:integrase